MDDFWNDESTSKTSFWDDDDDAPRMKLVPDKEEEESSPPAEPEAELPPEEVRRRDEMEERRLDEEEMPQREAYEKNRAWMNSVFAVYGKVTDVLLGMARAVDDGEAKEALEEKLWRLKYRLMQGPVRLLVLGASSSGKSTIVNALTGKVVSPEAAQVSTLIPAWVKGVASEIEEPLCYALRFGGDPKGEFKPRSDYLKEFCHPPEDRNSMPGGVETNEEGNTEPVYYAVRVETDSPFLAQSGITLLDTPGVEQNARETGMAADTAALGAEMLLLAARAATLKKEEQELFKQLLYDEERGMGLCVPRDVFCLFNEQLLDNGRYNLTIQQSFSDLSSGREPKEKIDMERRYYIVDALTERRKGEMYDFRDWSPKGMGFDSYKELNSLKAQEKKACEALAGAPYSPDMRHLLRDLKRRAWEIYADRGRVCAPIEKTLREAATELIAYRRNQAKRIGEEIQKEVAEMPAKALVTPTLERLRYELNRVLESGKFVVMADKELQKNCHNLLHEMRDTADLLKKHSETVITRFTERLSEEITLTAEAMDGKGYDGIAEPARAWFIKHRQAWQELLKNEGLEQLPEGTVAKRDDMAKLLKKILNGSGRIAERAEACMDRKTATPLDADAVVEEWKQEFIQRIGDGLASESELESEAASLSEYFCQQIDQYRKNRPNVSLLRGIFRMNTLTNLRAAALERLNESVKRDLQAYLDVLLGQKELMGQRINRLRVDVTTHSEALKFFLRGKREGVEAEEAICREAIGKELLCERVVPMEKEIERLERFMVAMDQRQGDEVPYYEEVI